METRQTLQNGNTKTHQDNDDDDYGLNQIMNVDKNILNIIRDISDM